MDMENDYDAEDYDDIILCPICSAYMGSESCWQCMGEGGFHDCGEDTCCCLDKEEITETCSECHGKGFYFQCSALPHTDEQMAAWRAKKEAES